MKRILREFVRRLHQGPGPAPGLVRCASRRGLPAGTGGGQGEAALATTAQKSRKTEGSVAPLAI